MLSIEARTTQIVHTSACDKTLCSKQAVYVRKNSAMQTYLPAAAGTPAEALQLQQRQPWQRPSAQALLPYVLWPADLPGVSADQVAPGRFSKDICSNDSKGTCSMLVILSASLESSRSSLVVISLPEPQDSCLASGLHWHIRARLTGGILQMLQP